MERTLQNAFRICLGFWLFAWFLKAPLLLPMLLNHLESPVLSHPLIPALFRNSGFTLGAYFLPLAALLVFATRSWRLYTIVSILLILCSGVLLLHIDTYNDATHTTSLWVGVWLLFLCLLRKSEAASTHVVSFGHLVLGLVFLGGFVGKMTMDYWDGTAIFEIYIRQKTNFPYPWFRETLSFDELRVLAVVLSWAAILSEFTLMLSPLIPTRILAPVGIWIMLVIVFFSHYNLFSVMGSLVGMLVACYTIARKSH